MKAKGVQRIDARKTHGYQVRVWDGQRTHTKMFSDGVWDGRREAFHAALKHRNKVMESLGIPVTNRVYVRNYTRNKSGAVGIRRSVSTTRRNGHVWKYPVWELVWCPEQGKRALKRFYIGKDGEQAALARAIAFREARMAEIFGMPARLIESKAMSEEEVIQRIKAMLPANLPLELKEEVQQEISLALLDGSLTLDALDACAVRKAVRDTGRNYSNPFQHLSLDHPIHEGCRLEDVLEG